MRYTKNFFDLSLLILAFSMICLTEVYADNKILPKSKPQIDQETKEPSEVASQD